MNDHKIGGVAENIGFIRNLSNKICVLTDKRELV